MTDLNQELNQEIKQLQSFKDFTISNNIQESVKNANTDLSVKKVKRSWCIMAGEAVIAKFRTEEEARKELKDSPEYYRYWANSVSYTVQNTKPKVVNIDRK